MTKDLKKQRVLGVIPARYKSTRLPGKMMLPILGKPLIEHTIEAALRSERLDAVLVATDDARIYDHVSSLGVPVVMTPEDCPNGTTRIAMALSALGPLDDVSCIVNIQGDDPCFCPSLIGKLAAALEDSDAVMSTACTPIFDPEEINNPSVVKCVFGRDGYALYFSRRAIPFYQQRTEAPTPYYQHIGVYGYRPDFLATYAALPATSLQQAEDLEQLKILEHGYRIKIVVIEEKVIGVNDPSDVAKVEKLLCKQNISL